MHNLGNRISFLLLTYPLLPPQLNMIWVSCDGENSADREHIGNVTYTPFRGFPAYYFPYKNIPGYLSPIVALQFQKPEGS